MTEDSSQKKESVDYQFHPNSAIKKFLTEISSPRLIGIINGVLGKNYPSDSQVTFGSNEFFTLTGNLDKNSRRCDLLVNLKTVPESENSETSKELKTLIELQSSKDKTMGFRMFVYALNVAEEDVEKQSYTLHYLRCARIRVRSGSFILKRGRKTMYL